VALGCGLAGLLLAGCSGEKKALPSDIGIAPAEGSAAGHWTVQVDLEEHWLDPGDVSAVRVGGVLGYKLRVDGDVLWFDVQGGPPGTADLVLQAETTVTIADAITYAEAMDPIFDRMVAIGASLTQGVQGGVPTQHGNLHAPATVVAQQAGAHFPLPLLVEGLFPSLGPGDVGAAPDCVVPDVVAFITRSATDVLGVLLDPETGEFDFGAGRVDPDVLPYNLAVGGARVQQVVAGPAEDDFAGQFMAHLVLEPGLKLSEPVRVSQLDRLEALDPTLVLSTDLYGNDIIGAVVNTEGIILDKITTEAMFTEYLTELVERLDATDAEVFLPTLPQPTLLPMAQEYAVLEVARAEAAAVASGEDPEAAAAAMAEDVAARLAEVDGIAERYNQILVDLVAGYGRIHVVDLAAEVDVLVHDGVEIDGQLFKVEKLGGLLSVDGIHFSDTGYALLGNLYITEINRVLGLEVPQADLAVVALTDPFAPATMIDGGLDPGCLP
jgi:lysophospholipase L1-like esterase